jgi:hypothetical protein
VIVPGRAAFAVNAADLVGMDSRTIPKHVSSWAVEVAPATATTAKPAEVAKAAALSCY